MTTPAGDPLHAHELSAADAAVIRMLSGATFGPDATVVLPSGRRVTGAEMARWVKPPVSSVTNLDLDAIEAREQAATKGPWHVRDDRLELSRWVHDQDGTLDIGFGYVGNRTEDDAAFVASARQDVPALVSEVKRLRTAVPSWADLHDLLAAKRDATDVELTNAVMALITGVDHE